MASKTPYNLEQLERTSKKTGIATLLGALVIIGALVYSTIQLGKMQDEVDQLETRSAELSGLIEERQDQLDELGTLIAEAQAELEDIEETPSSGIGSLSVSQQAEVVQKSESARSTLSKAAQTYADIKQKNDATSVRLLSSIAVDEFLVCTQVEEMEPSGCDTSFPASTVFAWARLSVQQAGTIEIRWIDAEGEIFREKKIDVDKSPNYRIFDAATFSPDKAGAYEVRILDSAGNQVGSQKFTITA